MDVLSILGIVGVAGTVVLDQGADIEHLQNELIHQKEAIIRVEEDQKNSEREITQQIKDLRKESKEQFDSVDRKLDKLIERELDRNGNH